MSADSDRLALAADAESKGLPMLAQEFRERAGTLRSPHECEAAAEPPAKPQKKARAPRKCSACNGTGHAPVDDLDLGDSITHSFCPRCGGSGKPTLAKSAGPLATADVKCRACGGRGRYSGSPGPCAACAGTGRIARKRRAEQHAGQPEGGPSSESQPTSSQQNALGGGLRDSGPVPPMITEAVQHAAVAPGLVPPFQAPTTSGESGASTLTLAPGPISPPDRTSYLGSGDIGQILGLSPHGSAISVFARKLGLEERREEEPEHLWIGSMLEPAIAQMYAARSGRKLVKAAHLLHPREPWAGETMDYLTCDPGPLLNVECKATFLFGTQYWPADAEQPPDHVLAQTTWQVGIARAAGLAVEGSRVPRLLVTGTFRIYEVAYDEELFDLLLARGRAFWRQVERREAPLLDGSDAAARYLRAKYPRDRAPLKPAPLEAGPLAAMYLIAKADREAAEECEDEAKHRLQELIGDSAGLDAPTWYATWKAAASGGTDWKATAETLAARLGWYAGVDGAEILNLEAEEHVRPGSRRFNLTEKKEKA